MIVSQMVFMLRVWQRYRTCVRELSRLSDLELADIGVTRSGIHWLAWRSSIGAAAGKPTVHASSIGER